jgi:hypothetical protein
VTRLPRASGKDVLEALQRGGLRSLTYAAAIITCENPALPGW